MLSKDIPQIMEGSQCTPGAICPQIIYVDCDDIKESIMSGNLAAMINGTTAVAPAVQVESRGEILLTSEAASPTVSSVKNDLGSSNSSKYSTSVISGISTSEALPPATSPPAPVLEISLLKDNNSIPKLDFAPKDPQVAPEYRGQIVTSVFTKDKKGLDTAFASNPPPPSLNQEGSRNNVHQFNVEFPNLAAAQPPKSDSESLPATVDTGETANESENAGSEEKSRTYSRFVKKITNKKVVSTKNKENYVYENSSDGA